MAFFPTPPELEADRVAAMPLSPETWDLEMLNAATIGVPSLIWKAVSWLRPAVWQNENTGELVPPPPPKEKKVKGDRKMSYENMGGTANYLGYYTMGSTYNSNFNMVAERAYQMKKREIEGKGIRVCELEDFDKFQNLAYSKLGPGVNAQGFEDGTAIYILREGNPFKELRTLIHEGEGVQYSRMGTNIFTNPTGENLHEKNHDKIRARTEKEAPVWMKHASAGLEYRA